jgi:periplasmic divalent cation tolerance protein
MADSDPRVVTMLVTAPDMETAEGLARALVEERLAACANVVPGVVSVYRWEGEVRRDAEVLMVLKTTESGAVALERRVVELHPYEVPEVLTLSVTGGHAPYLSWVRTAVEDADGA